MWRILFLLALLLPTACGTGDPMITLSGVCDGYPDSATSPYIAPWQVGATFEVSQGNCGGTTHNGRSKYSYDINMPIGTTIVAARAGTVYEVVEDKSDGNGCLSGENHVFIRHGDGSVAKYLHLTLNGVVPAVGDAVTQGQNIGLSGNTGCSGAPHLHFEVDVSRDVDLTIPITFSNVGSNRRGLIGGRTYRAQ